MCHIEESLVESELYITDQSMVSNLDLNAEIFAELMRRDNLFLQGVSASNFR